MAELDQISVATKRYIRSNPKLIDMVFQSGPLIKYMKTTLREEYTGGRLIGENFYYGALIGGAYNMGKEFDISEPQVEQELQFKPKFYEVNVTLTKEEIQVINKGENAAFRLIDSRMQNAYMTIGAQLEIGAYLQGLNSPYTANFNGLPEALNDGSTASWDGNTYTTYGTITRGGAVGTTLNSVPVNVNGVLDYDTLETTYGNATFGEIEPNSGMTTVIGYSLIKQKFQTQQRFNDTVDPNIGFRGMKFNGATIMKSRYTPGSYLYGGTVAGTADTVATGFIKQTTNGAVTAYPVPTGYTSGYNETFWWLNLKKPFANMYVSDDPEFQFGITGFKPAQGNTKVACQVLFSGAITFAPRYHQQLYGITG